jgi:outer membrane protein OmpA-like peptidoglycan-associated protein
LREEITIYKGILECQFIDLNKQSISSKYKSSKIKLEERFRFTDVIKVDNFPLTEQIESNSFIHQKGDLYPIEFYFKLKDQKDARYFATEILLLLKDDNSDSAIQDFEKVLNENNTNGNNFLSSSPINQHGKISGIAYCKIITKYDENNKEIIDASNDKLNDDIFNLSENSGCLFWLTSIFKPIFSTIFNMNSWIKEFINRFSSKVFNKNLINNQEPNAGCLNPMLPSGCTSSGCSQFGCGCLSLLLAIGFIFWLIWCVFLGKCNENQHQSTTDTKIIHDTIYIEVNKTKIDTIIKKDTIIYEDKTTKTKISVVSLPNVQFEKNKAILLNTSKSDLDRLGKHLLENEQIKAEIIGHTDDSGEFETNLKLSQDRAESVKQYLINLGIDGNRIKAVGKGESEPRASNATPEGRTMNRRVEVKLSETEKVEQSKERIKRENN